jgi:biopolymer transport protein ExbD
MMTVIMVVVAALTVFLSLVVGGLLIAGKEVPPSLGVAGTGTALLVGGAVVFYEGRATPDGPARFLVGIKAAHLAEFFSGSVVIFCAIVLGGSVLLMLLTAIAGVVRGPRQLGLVPLGVVGAILLGACVWLPYPLLVGDVPTHFFVIRSVVYLLLGLFVAVAMAAGGPNKSGPDAAAISGLSLPLAVGAVELGVSVSEQALVFEAASKASEEVLASLLFSGLRVHLGHLMVPAIVLPMAAVLGFCAVAPAFQRHRSVLAVLWVLAAPTALVLAESGNALRLLGTRSYEQMMGQTTDLRLPQSTSPRPLSLRSILIVNDGLRLNGEKLDPGQLSQRLHQLRQEEEQFLFGEKVELNFAADQATGVTEVVQVVDAAWKADLDRLYLLVKDQYWRGATIRFDKPQKRESDLMLTVGTEQWSWAPRVVPNYGEVEDATWPRSHSCEGDCDRDDYQALSKLTMDVHDNMGSMPILVAISPEVDLLHLVGTLDAIREEPREYEYGPVGKELFYEVSLAMAEPAPEPPAEAEENNPAEEEAPTEG